MHLACCYEYVHIAQPTDVRISCRENHVHEVACQSMVIQFDTHGHYSVKKTNVLSATEENDPNGLISMLHTDRSSV
jgi:hypothetical protein